MRIGLISDTHIPEARYELWPQVFDAFRGVDCILHAGDIHDLVVIDQLHDIAPTWAARGNGEEGSGGRPVQPDHHRLRESWLLDLDGLRSASPTMCRSRSTRRT
ncbi:MAG: metallophosphoesterase family protein [Dehalococcoidia bacterium]|nr:metallophosphoesterase family protein [Dehalococcoidia bacterium]